jgi:hypothetical protein
MRKTKIIIGDIVKHPEYDSQYADRHPEWHGQVIEINEGTGRARVRWHHDNYGIQKRTWIRIDRLK